EPPGQPADSAGARHGAAHDRRGRGLRNGAREPGARRGGPLHRGARRVPGRTGGDSLAPVSRDAERDTAAGRLRRRRAERGTDSPAAFAESPRCERRTAAAAVAGYDHAGLVAAAAGRPRARALASQYREVPMKNLTIPALAAIALIFVVMNSAFVIDQAEQGIIVQFGEPIGGVIDEPGLHWRVPFIQEVRRFDKRLLSWDGDVSQIPTLGREFIIVDATARWRILDPLQFLRSVRDEQGARTRLDDILDSVVRDIVSGTELEEIVRSADW